MTDPYSFAIPGYPREIDSSNHYLTLALTSIVSPSVLNSLRFGFTRTHFTVQAPTQPAILRYGSDYPVVGTLSIGGGISGLGPNVAGGSADVLQNMFSYSEDLSISRGAHAWKFGVMGERFRDFHFFDFRRRWNWIFTDWRNFLAGRATSVDGALPFPDVMMRDYYPLTREVYRLGLEWWAGYGNTAISSSCFNPMCLTVYNDLDRRGQMAIRWSWGWAWRPEKILTESYTRNAAIAMADHGSDYFWFGGFSYAGIMAGNCTAIAPVKPEFAMQPIIEYYII